MPRNKQVLMVFISLFLLLSISSAGFISLVGANPISARLMDEVPPDDKTRPPAITILSPENATVKNGTVALSFSVQIGTSETAIFMYIREVSYEGDWQENAALVYRFLEVGEKKNNNLSTFKAELNLTDVPEGNRTIFVYATGWGKYVKTVPNSTATLGFTDEYYPFKIASSSSVHFSVVVSVPNDTSSPENGSLNTAQPKTSPTATASPSATPTPLLTAEELEMSTPSFQPTTLPVEIVYATAGGISAIAGVSVAVVFLRRRQGSS